MAPKLKSITTTTHASGDDIRSAPLTERTITALKEAAPGKRYAVNDQLLKGFSVRVTDKGTKTFIVRKRVNGQARRFVVGDAAVMSLATARDRAREFLEDIEGGINPKEKAEEARREAERREVGTFANVAAEFVKRHASKLRSGTEVAAILDREFVSRWGSHQLGDITRRDVLAAIDDIRENSGTYMAHSAFAWVRRLFNWAIARDYIDASPCDRLKAADMIGAREKRQRVLDDTEMRALWKAADSLNFPTGTLAKLLLMTGQRIGEVSEMQWREVDLEKMLWTIPAERMKNQSAHTVPLTVEIVGILNGIPRTSSAYVFASRIGERQGEKLEDRPISGISKMKVRLDREMLRVMRETDPVAELTPWRWHDLRRSMRTGLSALPIPDNVRELLIAHAQPQLHQVYDRHRYDAEKAHAMALWIGKLMGIVEPRDNVVPIGIKSDSKKR